MNAYLHSAECDRVCLLFGLRRTGKTTLLRQAVLDMTPEDAAKTAYVKTTKQNTIADLNRDMEQLRSLGFWFALHQELYDRAKMIHTTFIPYREHSRLLGISQIGEYIRYGGTLRAGELAFDDAEVNAEDASFRDNQSTGGISTPPYARTSGIRWLTARTAVTSGTCVRSMRPGN